MTDPTDLWLAWTRGWVAAAHSVAEAQSGVLRALAPLRAQTLEIAAAPARAGNKPSRPRRDGAKGRKRKS